MSAKLDEIDRRILAVIQEDASVSAAELAERVGLSTTPCWRRLQKLKDQGYVQKQVAILDRKKLGFALQIFALVKLSAHGRANVAQFTAAVGLLPEVQECHITLGTMDALLRIVARDMDDYEHIFFHKLSSIAGVQEVTSLVSLTEAKSTTALPIR